MSESGGGGGRPTALPHSEDKDGPGVGPSLPLPSLPEPTHSQHGKSNTQDTKQLLRPAVFNRLESLVREMQDADHGVPVRSQKLFLTSIPAAFMGYDLIEWLMDRLCIEDSLEAVHLANLLCQFGYYFPVNEQKNLLVKDDSSLYRFQTPYYWPSQHHTPDNIEYSIYLYKRAQKNKKIHGLEAGLQDYEQDALTNLRKTLVSKWDFITMQAEEQLKLAKDRKKGDKIITDSQEKAYWRVYRPPPGYTTLVEPSPVPTREQKQKARRNNKELLKEEVDCLKAYLEISRVRTSQVAESLLDYTDQFIDYDPLLVGVGPSNPWITDDCTFWEINKPIVDIPTEKRVKRWNISLDDLIVDPLGVRELLAYMKKEYSHENLRFWLAVQELKTGPANEVRVKKKVKEIWDEFLSRDAKAEINIDGKTMDITRHNLKAPSRYTFDAAADHIYHLLLKKDCYIRFIRSESYKNLVANAINPGSSRKRFFNFGPVRKKISTQHPPGQPLTAAGAAALPSNTNVRERPNFGDCEIYGIGWDGDESDGDVSEKRKSISSTKDLDGTCPWETEEIKPPDNKPPEDKAAGTKNDPHQAKRRRERERKKSVTGSFPSLDAPGSAPAQLLSASDTKNKNNDPTMVNPPSDGGDREDVLCLTGPPRQLSIKYLGSDADPSSASQHRSQSAPGGSSPTSQVSPLHRKKTKSTAEAEAGKIIRKGSVTSGRQVGEVRAAVAAMCSIAATGQTIPVVGVVPSAATPAMVAPAILAPTTILNSKSGGIIKETDWHVSMASTLPPFGLPTLPSSDPPEATLPHLDQLTATLPSVDNPQLATSTLPLTGLASASLPFQSVDVASCHVAGEHSATWPASTSSSQTVELASAQTQTLARESSSHKQKQRQAQDIGGLTKGGLTKRGADRQEIGGITKRGTEDEYGGKAKTEDNASQEEEDDGKGEGEVVPVSEGAAGGGGGDGRNLSTSAAPEEDPCWMDPQNVCPWEDEEACKKESHPPFVKTYATLGYL